MFSDPEKNIEYFAFHSGNVVADLGSGSGHYTFLAAKAVGDTGKVFSVDIQKDLLVRIKNEANKRHQTNIEIVWGDLEKVGGTKIRDNALDAVMICNILFQVVAKDVFLQEIKRILKPGGRACVIDWQDSFAGLGPAAKDVFTMPKCKEFFGSGFTVEKEFPAGAHHYGIIFKKN